jgi:hypothetical protein
MSVPKMFRLLSGVLAFLAILLLGVSANAQMFSTAEEFLAHDWRGGRRIERNASAQAERSSQTLPIAIGPLPVPGGFLQAESTRFDRIANVMGPSREFPPAWPMAEGFPGRCYVSSRGKDSTTILFVWGTNGMAQCLAVFASKQQLAPNADCSPSDQIHSGLHTPEGLRLGITRSEVETLLGAPEGSAADRMGYARRLRLPATKRLLDSLGRGYEPEENTVLRYQQVMIWLQNDRVVAFAMEQNTHYN